MKRTITIALLGATTIVAACRDTSAPTSAIALSMASAFSSTPAGFDQLNTSFDAGPTGGPFEPEFDMHGHGVGGPRGMGHDREIDRLTEPQAICDDGVERISDHEPDENQQTLHHAAPKHRYRADAHHRDERHP